MFPNTINLSEIFNIRNLIIYLIVINIIAFAAMGIDKRRAKYGKWRIKEYTLFSLVLFGGGIGGIAGSVLGFLFAHFVSVRVFASTIVFQPLLLPVTVIVSVLITGLACLVPVKNATDVDPALVLKGE